MHNLPEDPRAIADDYTFRNKSPDHTIHPYARLVANLGLIGDKSSFSDIYFAFDHTSIIYYRILINDGASTDYRIIPYKRVSAYDRLPLNFVSREPNQWAILFSYDCTLADPSARIYPAFF